MPSAALITSSLVGTGIGSGTTPFFMLSIVLRKERSSSSSLSVRIGNGMLIFSSSKAFLIRLARLERIFIQFLLDSIQNNTLMLMELSPNSSTRIIGSGLGIISVSFSIIPFIRLVTIGKSVL